MWNITTETHFSAAHHLDGYHGKCCGMHGHNFKVSITVEAKKLKKEGFGMDFRVLRQKLEEVVNCFDHKNLNELPEFKKINPSAENIAKTIWGRMNKKLDKSVKLKEIKVWESEKNLVTYCE
ncbi:MAG: 6-carboxytetrahydropterin synthase QueD [bacterium]|nr:6-carboxytetrahydropterin synthase QueD [bacterium]